MRHYSYKALDSKRQVIEGEMDVEDPKDLDRFFFERQFTPVKIKERKINPLKDIGITIQIWWNKKLFEKELITFTRQFAAAYGAGLSVAKTLDLLAKQTTHRFFRN